MSTKEKEIHCHAESPSWTVRRFRNMIGTSCMGMARRNTQVYNSRYNRNVYTQAQIHKSYLITALHKDPVLPPANTDPDPK